MQSPEGNNCDAEESGRRRELAKHIFLDALELPEDARSEFISSSCAGDEGLQASVVALLKTCEAEGQSLLSLDFGRILVTELVAVNQPSSEGKATSTGEGRYRLGKELGRGGFGVVYRAQQTSPVEREVAIKLLRTDASSNELLGRFKREQRTLAMMNHPNIARVLDAGADEQGLPFLAMELVEGVPITEYCDTHQVPIAERLQIFMNVCRGVQHAHQKGIVHQDIKPANVLVSMVDGQHVPKIIDFGIARTTNAATVRETRFTKFGELVGSPAYMAPEQADSQSDDVDTRSDLYSLGVLLYELLTGTLPFAIEDLLAKGYQEMLRCICEEEPNRPSVRVSGVYELAASVAQQRGTDSRRLSSIIKGDLDWIVMRCLEKEPDRRYETTNGLIEDIQRHLDHEPVIASPPSIGYQFTKFVRRNRAGVIAASLVTIALLLGITGTTFGLVWAIDEKERAIVAEADTKRELKRAVTAEAETKRQLTRASEVKRLTMAMLKNVRPESAGGEDTALLKRILAEAAERLDEGKVHDARIESEMRLFVGDSYMKIGLPREAKHHFLRMREILEELNVSNTNPEWNLATIRLASACTCLGEFKDAEALLVKAVPVCRQIYGDQARQAIHAMGVFGDLRLRQRRWEESYSWYSLALESSVGLGPELALSVLKTRSNLAVVLFKQRRYAEAEQQQVENLKSKRKLYDNDHPSVLNSMGNLAATYSVTKQFEKAEPLYLETLERQTRILGMDHPTVITVQQNLGNMYLKTSEYEKAEPYLSESFETAKRILGEDHRSTRISRVWLAELYLAKGQHTKAKPLLARIHEYSQDESAAAVKLTSTERELAKIYTTMQEIKSAELHLQEATSLYGSDHKATINATANLGSLLIRTQRYDEGVSLLVDLFPLQQQVLGSDHPDLVSAAKDLTVGFSGLKQYDKATKWQRKVVELKLRIHGPEDRETLQSQRELIRLLTRTEATEALIEVVESSLPNSKKTLGQEHSVTLYMQAALAGAYGNSKQLAKAEKLFRHTIAVKRRVLGPKHPSTLATRNNLAWAYCVNDQPARGIPIMEDVCEIDKQSNLPRSLHLDTLGCCYFGAGQIVAAYETQKLVVRLPNPDPTIHDRMAQYTAAFEAMIAKGEKTTLEMSPGSAEEVTKCTQQELSNVSMGSSR